jgi:hypothetical protein
MAFIYDYVQLDGKKMMLEKYEPDVPADNRKVRTDLDASTFISVGPYAQAWDLGVVFDYSPSDSSYVSMANVQSWMKAQTLADLELAWVDYEGASCTVYLASYTKPTMRSNLLAGKYNWTCRLVKKQ